MGAEDTQRSAKVLVVDDEPGVLSVLAHFLRGEVSVCTASSAEEALRILRGGLPINIVISDYGLPGMDGFEFLGVVQREFLGVGRILMSGQRKPENIGQIPFLAKPAARAEVLGTVKEMLGQIAEGKDRSPC